MMGQKHSESAVLVGASTHNQRIERLWRDTSGCVCIPYADNRLNPFNEVDLFCLHTVFNK